MPRSHTSAGRNTEIEVEVHRSSSQARENFRHGNERTSSGRRESQCDRDRHSLSRSPTPSPPRTPPRSRPQANKEESSSDIAPTLTLILDAIAAMKSDIDKLKENKDVSNLEPVFQKTASPLASPGGFSGFRSTKSKDCSVEVEVQEDAQRESVLMQGAKNYGPMEKVSEELDKEVAAMVNHLFVNGMREEDYKDIMDDDVTLRPSNCHALTKVDCNKQVLDALPAEARKADFRLREVGKDITKAATIVVKSLTVLDKVANEEENPVVAQEVAMLNGALALLGNAHYRNNLTRRHVIKRDINPKYSHLCTDKTQTTGLLFGDDISQATKEIDEAERLKSKFTSKRHSTSWTSSTSRFGGSKQRNFFGKAPSRGFSSRYQPYGLRRTVTRSDPRRNYPTQASTSKNLRGRGLYNPRR